MTYIFSSSISDPGGTQKKMSVHNVNFCVTLSLSLYIYIFTNIYIYIHTYRCIYTSPVDKYIYIYTHAWIHK